MVVVVVVVVVDVVVVFVVIVVVVVAAIVVDETFFPFISATDGNFGGQGCLDSRPSPSMSN